jgi:hypothetical protein
MAKAKLKLTPEKELLIGLIVSDEFTQQIRPLLHTSYLQSNSSKVIAKWCMDYYDQYHTAPNQFIQDIYNQNKKALPEDDAILISKTLSHVSEHYTKKDTYNAQYAIDKALLYIRERRVSTLQEQLEHDLVVGHIDKAENAIMGYTKLARAEHEKTNLWDDTQVVHSIFNTESSSLFKMPGALGELLGDFRRGNLYSYAGVAKRGKSRWLLQTAALASLHRMNTVVVSLEMSKEETSEILLNSFVRKPTHKHTEEPCEVTIPRFTEENSIVYDEVKSKPATVTDYLKWQKKAKMLGAPVHQIISEPDSMTIDDLNDKLISLEYYEGFTPDVLCIAEGSLVLTEGRGLVPIEQIKLSDKLWDGENWVSHDGLIYKGEKEVIKYGNIEATPDHLFWTEEGWRSLESCKELGLRIAQTECDGERIRIGENYISYSEGERKEQDKKRTKTVYMVRLREVWEMWKRKVDKLWEPKKGDNKRMQDMHADEAPKGIPDVVEEQGTLTIHKMQPSEPSFLEILRRARNRISVQKHFRCLSMDKRESRNSRRQKIRDRSNRQRWALRTGKSEMVDKKAKLSSYEKTYDYGKNISFPSIVSICKICRQYITKIIKKDDTKGSVGEMEPKYIQKKSVWDIRNAGHFHRFTVQGVLAHNCIDYADILKGKGYDSRDRVNNIWMGLKRLAKQYHCAVITATHLNGDALLKDASGYNVGEDKRKLNHVSGMYILNQTEEEKRSQIMRVKATATRFGQYTELDEVVVLYNYGVGRTYIDSRFKHDVEEYKE